ncbi:putative ABC transporter permease [Luxibacter massiliensis]|uniref:putative ABC transporter permease n=1 Tax=Luxibacter massiliensis TaxID=2219695 RepID=UPI000F05FC45|nr:hypothetical protein [Luxibacter massiliensis]
MKNKSIAQNKFIICGTVGWCMEIIFTALHSFKRKEFTLVGRTSIWMFPIYGAACLLSPVCHILKGKSTIFRGSVYTFCIFLGEFLSGSFLRRHHACPWDYSGAKYNLNGVIRFDYAPLWFGAGLLFEKILK